MMRATKEYRSLKIRRELLETYRLDPVVRHLVYLIDDAMRKMGELEELQSQLAILDDKIYCAKAFVSEFSE